MSGTAEKIKVMQAFENGKEIEFRQLSKTEWCLCGTPLWLFGMFDYRVKPELKQIDWSKMPKDVVCKVCNFDNGNYVYRHHSSTRRFYQNGFDSFTATERIDCCYSYVVIVKNPPVCWFGGDCPLPEGLKINIWYRDGDKDTTTTYSQDDNWRHEKDESDIIAYQILGVADGWKE